MIVPCATFSKSLNPRNIDKSVSDIRIRDERSHIFQTQRRQTATKSFPTFKLDITVSYVGHAFQTCRVIISNKCMQLLIT